MDRNTDGQMFRDVNTHTQMDRQAGMCTDIHMDRHAEQAQGHVRTYALLNGKVDRDGGRQYEHSLSV